MKQNNLIAALVVRHILNVEQAEITPKTAFEVNGEGVKRLYKVCK
ncbi:hypothetical protein [Algibacter sp. L1A34]|nr:hypothetical protein [Algibacter sp. L1A34]